MSKIRGVVALMGAIALSVVVPDMPAHAADATTIRGGAVSVYTPVGLSARGAVTSGSVSSGDLDFTIQNCGGRYEEFKVFSDRSVQHRWQIAVNGEYSRWDPLNGQVLYSEISGFVNDCRIEIFGVGLDMQMYTTFQYLNSGATPPGGTAWPTSWASLAGGFHGGPTSRLWYTGSTYLYGVCATGLDYQRWCNHHTQPYGSPWTGWYLDA
ncbi:hypothetical protein ACPPVO_53940 [Dactylosporangium sp. McL0621]|uniref:hypothetical protein n=1 Tax=Dactylosporangium sp. McL0621 TaxID=3415678 RepID=UPI003CFA191A